MKRIFATILALSVLGTSVALADSRDREHRGRPDQHHADYDRGNRHDRGRNYDRGRAHRDRYDRRDHFDRRDGYDHRRPDDWRHHYDRDRRHDRGHRYDRDRPRFRAGPYYRPHGYRPHHWRRGDRLPRAYYARPYVIHHWHGYQLRRPPRGCHWVRVDRDVVLAAIATGVILEVLHDHFH